MARTVLNPGDVGMNEHILAGQVPQRSLGNKYLTYDNGAIVFLPMQQIPQRRGKFFQTTTSFRKGCEELDELNARLWATAKD